jgi:hypothetical protein
VILDSDENISGIYPKIDGKLVGTELSIPFIGDDSRLFRLDVLNESRDYSRKNNGVELWHARLGHISSANIMKSDYVKGLDHLLLKKKSTEVKVCLHCMVGKSQRCKAPASKESAKEPLAQVNSDIIMASELSIQGLRYAAIFTDNCSGMIWVYGLRDKSQMIDIVKKFDSDIAILRVKHKLVTVMRDNAGENRSQVVEDFLQSIGVRSYYSAAYEQWQNGSAETGFRTLTRSSRSVLHQSRMGSRFWFDAMVAAAHASNVTFKSRIGTTTLMRAYGATINYSQSAQQSL